MRKLLAILLCLMLIPEAPAQEQAEAEQRVVRNVQNVLDFNREFPQEKVFLQFDNTSYYQGETIWFKAFVVNASTLERSNSRVLYVELLSPTGIMLQQLKLQIYDGQADGCFNLTDSSVRDAVELRGNQPYPSGYYEVRAYTRYMLNFSESIVFSRVLPVFKSPVSEGKYEDPVIENLEKGKNNVREIHDKLKEVNVSFFPEGGSLHPKTPARVAFKATDKTGMPIDGTLLVNNHYGKDSIISAQTIHDGMGRFELLVGSRSPNCVFIHEGREYKVSGPKLDYLQGLSLKINQMTDSISAIIYNATGWVGTFAIAVCCRGQIYHAQTFFLDIDSAHLTIPTADIPMGVCQLTVMESYGIVRATRHFFNYRPQYSPPALTARTDKTSYAPYEHVSMDLSLLGGDGKPFRDRFCLSVRDGNSLKTASMDNLATSLLLSSDLRGLILNPEYYFESDDAEHRIAMDLLCMVQGWERYNFTMMEGRSPFEEKYRREEKMNLNGRVISYLNSYRSIDSVHTFLSVAPVLYDSLLYSGHYLTGKDGYFGFDIGDFYGPASVFVRLSKKNILGKEKALMNMTFERAKIPAPRTFSPEELVFGYDYDEIVHRKDNYAVTGMGSMYSDDGIKLPEVEIVAPRKYIDYFTFKAIDVEKDVEYQLDLGELPSNISGYLLGKGYKIDPQFDVLNLSSTVTAGTPDDFAAILNDFGMWSYAFQKAGLLDHFPAFWYVHDSKGLVRLPNGGTWSLNTQNIESILVFDDAATLPEIAESVPLLVEAIHKDGNPKAIAFMNGDYSRRKFRLVEIRVKDRRPDNGQMLDLGKRIMKFDGYYIPAQFYSPQYPDGPIEGTKKDYRRTLYWNPNVITDSLGHARIDFYNNSYSTRFNVNGAGITAGGSPYVLNEDF